MTESEEDAKKRQQLEQLRQKQKEMEDQLLSPESLSKLGTILSEELTSRLGMIHDCSADNFDNLEETSHNIDVALESAERICHILRILEGKADIQHKTTKEAI